MTSKRLTLAFAGITAGFLALFAINAEASTPTAPASVCETGYRGQREYDTLCLATGTYGDAGVVWYQGNSDKYRRSLCRSVGRYHGMRNLVHEVYGDVIYDNFRNDKAVEVWTARMGTANCRALGVTG